MEVSHLGESVLVVPTTALMAAVSGRGFLTVPAAWAALGEASFLPRDAAEDDERFRQIIPYLILRSGDHVFTYLRNRRGHEARLHDRRSVGVGGHVTPNDLSGGLAALVGAPHQALAAAARRELREEVAGVPPDARLDWIGFILDDSAPVSRVHCGVVFTTEVDQRAVRLSEEGRMVDGRFDRPRDLARNLESYEAWSQLTIAHLASVGAR